MSRKPARCGICTARLLPGDATRRLPHVGRVHEDCADSIEQAIADGGCNRSDYLRQIAGAMSDAA